MRPATVLRNGKCVATTPLAGWSEARLTEAMIGGTRELFSRTERSAGEALISVKGLAWGGRVRDVAFVARRGEVLALTGLLGAGQNEIARLIGGDFARRRAASSQVGDEVAQGSHSPHDAVAAGICLLTEERKHEGILPNLPLRENIAVASLGDRAGFAGAVRQADERSGGREDAAEPSAWSPRRSKCRCGRCPAATSRRRCSRAGISPMPTSSS